MFNTIGTLITQANQGSVLTATVRHWVSLSLSNTVTAKRVGQS